MNKLLAAHWDGDILTIQEAEYIEDGWYIMGMPDGTFHVYLIPQYGGTEAFVGEFPTIKEAIIATEEVT